jgi:hypothetical protein
VGSADDDVRVFVDIVLREAAARRSGAPRVLGELMLSAMLIVCGMLLLAPAVAGPTSLSSLL